ncbi:Cysteine-rich receptor-like protein kinase [Sesamum alatum]|uniref:non-specific serine/threonine protein kinase n=1 Tax=Sesamum alatum TaxID=300844 RepID=A0AAE1YZU5_9LAMI|nr:Cysteine-rich receptor-like protein kinase [Sesamum alatum]
MMSAETWKLLLVLINLFNGFASGQVLRSCMNNWNFTSNSTYAANLNSLLSSLSSNVNDTGFYSASMGQNADRVNAIVLCRADQTLDRCRSCVQNAAVGIVQWCPNKKEAIIWYELCMLRYSNESIYGFQTINDPQFPMYNVLNATSLEQFREDRRILMDDLRRQAANGSSLWKARAGFRNTSDIETIYGLNQAIYGLVQCTPDLSPQDCDDCLIRAGGLRRCCDNARGVRMLMPSCNLRYELYPFYNETRMRELHLLAPPQPPSTPSSPPGKKDGNKTRNIIIIVVPIAICVTLGTCATIYLSKRIKRKPHQLLEGELAIDEISSIESLHYDFGKIRAATNDFSDANKLGKGGFGVVYWGKLLTGQEIAVKRLSKNSGQGNIEFKNEVLLVARLQHRNLVRLLGFSLEGIERLLIYEFVQNASLDQFIFDRIKSSQLNWERRYKIIEGIARGILYLHEDSRLRIIHRDLKASNVLLDGDMNPKIADFGMARLSRNDETQGNTNRIVGTYGYMAPEYAMHGQFSVKSDVFSFGVLVLEIISGQKNNCFRSGENLQDLLSFVWKNWREGTSANVVDLFLRSGSGSMNEMQRKNNENTTRNIIIIVVAIALFLLIIAACAAIYLRKRIKRKPQELHKATDEINTVETLLFDFGKIRAATSDFSEANKLGQGGFGAVYWGKLPNGQEIAVKRRYKIIAGIARGLVYLHEDSRFKIIHRDLKASNVLLDGDMNPKIVDFGMARLFGQDETHRNTSKIAGTYWRDGTAASVIDPILRADTSSQWDILRCIHIGLLCVQEIVANRPTIASIVLMLNSTTITLPVPSQPPFLVSTHFGPDISRFEDHDSKESNSNKVSRFKEGVSEGSSQNEVSSTELYPR